MGLCLGPLRDPRHSGAKTLEAAPSALARREPQSEFGGLFPIPNQGSSAVSRDLSAEGLVKLDLFAIRAIPPEAGIAVLLVRLRRICG